VNFSRALCLLAFCPALFSLSPLHLRRHAADASPNKKYRMRQLLFALVATYRWATTRASRVLSYGNDDPITFNSGLSSFCAIFESFAFGQRSSKNCAYSASRARSLFALESETK